MSEKVATPLGLDTYEASYGVHQIASSTMARAVSAVSLERGRDPRDFTLFAFGGCGPLHAAEMARPLGIREILVPPWPGLFSAFGLLLAELEHHYLRTHQRRTGDIELDDMAQIWTEMAAEALTTLEAEGYSRDEVVLRRFADLRYAGQSFELTLPVPPGELGLEEVASLEEDFAREHERTYGHSAPGDPIELVNLRLVAGAISPRSSDQETETSRGEARARATMDRAEGAPRKRQAYYGPDHGFLETLILERWDLAERAYEGPIIIEEYDATVVVPPGSRASLDEWGNIRIRIGEGR